MVAFSSQRDQTVSAFLPLNSYNFQARDSPVNNRTFDVPPHTFKQEMCTNTVYSDAMFDNFVNNVPAPFVQPYFQCQKRAFAAFQDAAGNAAGIAGALAMVVIFLLGFLFKFIQNYRAARQKIRDPRDTFQKRKSKLTDLEAGKKGSKSLIHVRHKSTIIERLQGAKEEKLMSVIECLVENSQKQRDEHRASIQQLQEQHQCLQQQLMGGGGGSQTQLVREGGGSGVDGTQESALKSLQLAMLCIRHVIQRTN